MPPPQENLYLTITPSEGKKGAGPAGFPSAIHVTAPIAFALPMPDTVAILEEQR